MILILWKNNSIWVLIPHNCHQAALQGTVSVLQGSLEKST